MPTAVKPGWPVAGYGPAVVHRRADGDAGRHLVVEQAADARPQARREPVVERVVRAARVGVDAAGQVAFEAVGSPPRAALRRGDDEERRVAEGLGLQLLRRGEELRRPTHGAACCSSGSPAAAPRAAVTRLAPAACSVATLAARARATPADSSVPAGAASNFARTPAMNASVASPATSSTRPGLVQNWPVPIRQLVGELVHQLGAALGERARQDHHGVDAREFEVDRLAGGVGGRLERQPAARLPV